MKQVLIKASRSLFSALADLLLIGIASVIAGAALTLTALYLIDHMEETPATKSLQCFIGISRPDCPRYAEEITELQAELKTMIDEREALEDQLTGLRAVETAVDEITLFESHTDPVSGLEVTVGTVYTEFVKAQPSPEAYFCYLNLPLGPAGESRNLHFKGRGGEITVSSKVLKKANITARTLNYARSACKPFVIG